MDRIKKVLKHIKDMFDKEKNSKWGENLVIIIIIGVIIIIAGGALFDDNGTKKKAENEVQNTKNEQEIVSVAASGDKSDIEKEIEEILSKINGVGKVNVMITYESGKEIVPYQDIKKNDNNTEEKDNAGGTRKINQSSYESNVVYEEVGSGVRKPVIAKELMPKVQGVLVVAQGVSEPTVKENIINSVRVLLNVPVHKIHVVEGE
ncbi:MAG TPA: stage III sporulation protein AG [Acetivibrio sp.]|nr:stage III sporulation protein AG [Clostridium sp.]HPT90346.1 stage III sporulation protein AG [Acetivibrio sp.]HQA58590.1 stage III sporulation protein AG [Acetivibrio sp.]